MNRQGVCVHVSDVCVWTLPRYKVLSYSWDASATVRIRIKFREIWHSNQVCGCCSVCHLAIVDRQFVCALCLRHKLSLTVQNVK